jgi:3-hydroxyacyl-CoA dehydrogenase
MSRTIKKVAILGSGIMGSRIACHFANIGCNVLLLDIPPSDSTPEAPKAIRNKIVNDALTATFKAKPSSLYSTKFVNRITTGNFDDNLSEIASCDWIMEVIIERLDIKQGLFEKVEKFRKPGTLISSNTSGIPIHLMLEGRSDDFKKHFCGTHFFNPPRYLELLEIIPTPHTDPAITEFMLDFGSQFLGKKTILCKDTPAFIANRIGVYSIMQLFHLSLELGFTTSEVDLLTGPLLGRPKSATFRTCDVVGLDTLVHVANGVKASCPNDEEKDTFIIPSFIEKMMENKQLGDKTKGGFFKMLKHESGEREILSLNFETSEYEKGAKRKFGVLDAAKPIEDTKKRVQFLLNDASEVGQFYRKSFAGLFAYAANRIPEISDSIYAIDDAIKAGFGWELGIFETWDLFGIQKGIELIKTEGKTLATWVNDFAKDEKATFYGTNEGKKTYYNIATSKHEVIPGARIDLDALPETALVWSNADCRLEELGDNILNLSFSTKMNTIGGGVIAGVNKAITIAEERNCGLVISNKGQNFSAGANVAMIFMMAVEQEFDELNQAVKMFQDTSMRIRYSSIPVVIAPFNMALGGGCEFCLHADKVVAHSELYMGLVEFGVGLIPGGGGTKEFAKRLSDEMKEGDIRINRFRDKFLTIGQAKVATSAQEAFEFGYLREGIDEIVMNKSSLLARAKAACQDLLESGYKAPIPEKNIQVLGQEALGIVYVGAHSMKSGKYISEHDQLISEKLGFVLAGGDLSAITTVSEQYLLDLERKTFMELCREKKTLERLQSLVKSGKILRN